MSTIVVGFDYMIIDMIKKPYPGQAGFTLDSFFPPDTGNARVPVFFLLYTPTGYDID